ncbi:MAG: hypothetical protein J0H17_08155 [Rhizobiales bacterium]|nr:hypothetical protein [Hyphomicrobiales bacterium]
MTVYFVENPTGITTALGRSCFGPHEGKGARDKALDIAKKLARAPGTTVRVFGTDGEIVTVQAPAAAAISSNK